MKDQDKTKKQLINELAELRQVITVLEESETEHRRTVQALRKSIKRYRSLTGDVLDSSRVGMFVLDSDFKVVMINNGLELFFGLQREKIVGKDKRQLIEKSIKNIFEDPESFSEKVLATYDNNTYIENFECYVLAEGEREERWLEHWSQPIISGIYAGGRIEQYIDITLRKQAEERINHLNAVLRAIRQVNELIIKEKDRDRLLQDVCDRLIETRGYYNTWIAIFDESRRLVTTAEAGLGNDFLPMVELLKRGELIDCGRRALAQSRVVAIKDPPYTCTDCPLSGKYSGRGAITVRLEHGGTVYGLLAVSIPAALVTDEEEQTLFKEVAEDIAFALHSIELEEERKRTEEALRESEEKYRTLFEGSRDAVYITTQGGKFVDFNQSMLDLFGYTREEMMGVNVRETYAHPVNRERVQKSIEEKGFVRDYELKLCKNDGTEMDCLITATTRQASDGSILGYQGIIRDITERKRAEEGKKKLQAQLQQAQKMEAIGTLAGGIAHDFNNILAAVIGYSELAKMKLPEGRDVISDLDEVLKAGDRAKNLVQHILTFSRQREEEKKPLQIHLIAKEALKLLRPSLPTTIEIRQNIPSTATILADPTQIYQVIMNLCTNAYHAMHEKGGVLEVSLADVELDSDFTARHLETHPGPYVKLTVSDTGHGMDKTVIDHIFEPYYTTKEKGKGTGMGLAVVHGIVKDHGGSITVYSEPGKGSTFNVFLPRIEVTEVEAKPEEITPLPMGKEQILFVDDEPAIVDIGKRMLEHLGYKVEVRTSPIETLEAFRTQPNKFDLVITDMTMPNMRGDELAKKLMAMRPDIPIILCTGFSERITEEKAKAMGIRAFAMKPFVMRDLANVVRRILDG